MRHVKNLNEEQISQYDSMMQRRFPGRDVFFVSSAAYDAEISEATLRNHLSGDSSLCFVNFMSVELKGGGIATCSSSMRAWGENRRLHDGRKTLETWKENFPNVRTSATSCSPITVPSSGSAGS